MVRGLPQIAIATIKLKDSSYEAELACAFSLIVPRNVLVLNEYIFDTHTKRNDIPCEDKLTTY